MESMRLLIIATVCSFYCCIAQSQYKMQEYITCLEQNDLSPFGFKEWTTYLNATWCKENNVSHLCALYANEPYPNQGDVCDHADPTTGTIRNACKMEIIFGPNETETKTWSWKCIDISTCVLKDVDGAGIPGCYIAEKRINCCCNDRDYCQDHPVYLQYAEFGRADHYPINFTALLSINPGDIYVEVDPSVPGYDTFAYGPPENATIIDVAACDVAPNDRLLDVLIMVDGSCPMDINECQQQQIDIADTMAALRGIETYNVDGSNSLLSRVKIGYIEVPTTGGRTGVSRTILGLDDSLNVNINDADQARVDIYDKIMSSNTMCIDPEERGGNPNLADAVNIAFDIFDGIDNEGNSTSDKVILIVSNCGASEGGRGIDLCTLYEGRKREDVKVIMINNKPDISGSMAEPEGYKTCLVEDDINRIFVVYDGDNYQDIIPQIQSQICIGSPLTNPVPLTTQEATTSNIAISVSPITAIPTTSNPSLTATASHPTTPNPTTSTSTTPNPTTPIPTTPNPTTPIPVSSTSSTIVATSSTITSTATSSTTSSPTGVPTFKPTETPPVAITNNPTAISQDTSTTISTDLPSTSPTNAARGGSGGGGGRGNGGSVGGGGSDGGGRGGDGGRGQRAMSIGYHNNDDINDEFEDSDHDVYYWKMFTMYPIMNGVLLIIVIINTFIVCQIKLRGDRDKKYEMVYHDDPEEIISIS